MLTVTRILGNALDEAFAAKLHRLEHAGKVEFAVLDQQATQRHRLRAMTDRGTSLAIALARSESLSNGAVLLLEEDRAIVVRMAGQQWLTLRVADAAAGLELGYFAGNMHWKVQFDGDALRIALEGPQSHYLERLAHLLQHGRIIHVDA